MTDADNPIEVDEWKTTVNKMNAVDLIFTIMFVKSAFYGTFQEILTLQRY